jgi:hypothetical protein
MFKSIKRLDLSFNQMKKYPKQLCQLNQLESLNLSFNDLNENDFPSEIEQYTQLIELTLDNNGLKRIPRLIALKCSRLMQRLSIRNNQLIDLKYLENFKNLRILLLDHNSLSKIEDFNLKQLNKLQVLDLKHNQLVHIKSNIFKMNKSNSNVSASSSSSLPLGLNSNMNFMLMNLKNLDLSYNKLIKVPSELFFCLPQLEILNLSHNNLCKIGPFNESNQSLMSSSSSSSLNSNSNNRVIRIYSIDLSFNKLCRFNECLIQLAQNLDFTSNKIKSLNSKHFLNLSDHLCENTTIKFYLNPIQEPPLNIIHPNINNSNNITNESKIIKDNNRNSKTYLTSKLSLIKEYFNEVEKKTQINCGLKLIFIGSTKSGKTSLAYALEDFNCQTNQIEEFNINSENELSSSSSQKQQKQNDLNQNKEFNINSNDDNNEDYYLKDDYNEENENSLLLANNDDSKFIEIHELYFKETFSSFGSDFSSSINVKKLPQEDSSKNNKKIIKSNKKKKLISVNSNEKFLLLSNNNNSSLLKEKEEDEIEKELSIKNKIAAFPLTIKTPITVYDFNGDFEFFGHLMNIFLDKRALIIYCIDYTKFKWLLNLNLNEKQQKQHKQRNLDNYDVENAENYDDDDDDKFYKNLLSNKNNENEMKNLNELLFNLNTILYRLSSKVNQYSLLFVLTKCDLDSSYNLNLNSNSNIKLIQSRIEKILNAHLEQIEFNIKFEIEKIEHLQRINQTQSERLKHLIQMQANFKQPTLRIHEKCLCISSLLMHGIENLTQTIKNIMLSSSSSTANFTTTNSLSNSNFLNRIPTFWLDAEKYFTEKMYEMPMIKIQNNSMMNMNTNENKPYEIMYSDSVKNNLINILCVDYIEFEQRLVYKFGMKHMIEKIAQYLHQNGKLICYHFNYSNNNFNYNQNNSNQGSLKESQQNIKHTNNTNTNNNNNNYNNNNSNNSSSSHISLVNLLDKQKRKLVFVRPALLFDLINTIFKKNFYENFTQDSALNDLRIKMFNNTMVTFNSFFSSSTSSSSTNSCSILNDDYIKLLVDNFTKKGTIII